MYYLTGEGLELLEGSRSSARLARKAMAVITGTPRAKRLGGVAPHDSLEHKDDDSLVRSQARPHNPDERLKNIAAKLGGALESDKAYATPKSISRARTRSVGTSTTEPIRQQPLALSMMSQSQPRVRQAIRNVVAAKRQAAQARNFERS